MNLFICGEGQAEEADRDEYPTDLAHYETELGRRIAILLKYAPVASMKGKHKYRRTWEPRKDGFTHSSMVLWQPREGSR
jgi:hypothetical protein